MLPANRQAGETLQAWEARLITEQPARERAQQRDRIMAMPEHEYRRRKAEACAEPRRPVLIFPDAMTMSNEEYAAAKAKAGIFTASLIR